jgi:hypothetical protein
VDGRGALGVPEFQAWILGGMDLDSGWTFGGGTGFRKGRRRGPIAERADALLASAGEEHSAIVETQDGFGAGPRGQHPPGRLAAPGNPADAVVRGFDEPGLPIRRASPRDILSMGVPVLARIPWTRLRPEWSVAPPQGTLLWNSA